MVQAKFFKGLPLEAKNIRQKVFMEEQGFKNEFIPHEDDEAYCLIIYKDGNAIATGRIIKDDPESYHIGRVAVLKEYRHQKVGSTVLKFLETKIVELGGRRALLGAQLDKKDFYLKCGYKIKEKEPFLDEGVPHLHMEKFLK